MSPLRFPVALRKMWSGGEVQAWLDAQAAATMTTPQIERPQPDECPVCRSKDIRVHEGDTFRWRYAICDACGFRGDEVRISTLGEGTREEWEAEVRLEAIADMHRIYDACTAPLRAENERQAKRIAELEAALRDFVNDYTDRFDMDSPSTNLGMKYCVAQGRALLAPSGSALSAQGEAG